MERNLGLKILSLFSGNHLTKPKTPEKNIKTASRKPAIRWIKPANLELGQFLSFVSSNSLWETETSSTGRQNGNNVVVYLTSRWAQLGWQVYGMASILRGLNKDEKS